jgi:hypothetical protein
LFEIYSFFYCLIPITQFSFSAELKIPGIIFITKDLSKNVHFDNFTDNRVFILSAIKEKKNEQLPGNPAYNQEQEFVFVL